MTAVLAGRLVAFLVATTIVCLAPRTAVAFPQWQLSSGATRCNQCHYAPAGGGLINTYGRDAAGEQLSTFDGNGGLLHGAISLPSWLALGGDLRGAFVAHDAQDPQGATAAVFPMQADAYGRVALGAGISVSGTVGLRGQIRDPDVLVPEQNYQPISASRFISREHTLQWQPETIGPYLRAGRFFAPFGLRLAEHVVYVRRDLGFDRLQETYNLSGGFVYDRAELHLTLFAPDFVRHIGSLEKGFAGYFETRVLDDRIAVAGQMRLAAGPGVTRFMVGAVGKAYVERLRTLFLAELNAVQLIFDDSGNTTRQQIVGAGGFAVLPVRGLVVTMLGEHNQLDVAFPNSWTAVTGLVNWFPAAHFDIQLMGRLQFPSGGEAAKTFLAQIHYFL
ncbi:MAG: hypothetical protein ABUL67_03020 [Haliangium ochraceum]